MLFDLEIFRLYFAVCECFVFRVVLFLVATEVKELNLKRFKNVRGRFKEFYVKL